MSIVVPAYEAAGYLEATLASCLRQTVQPREVIVVDDGSTDSTAEVAQGFGPAVKVERISNGGVSRARNIGARLASGDALVFLDADDVLLPHALEVLGARLTETGAGMAYGMVIERMEPPKLSKLNGFAFAEGKPPVPAARNFWRCAVITPGSAMVRADLHQRVEGFTTGYEPLEDRDYWIRCGLLESASFCDTVILDKTWRPASHGSQHSKRIFRGQRALRALRSWCLKHGLDTTWMPSDEDILRRALDEAVWRRRRDILGPLRNEAATLGVRHWRSALLALTGLPPAPAWTAETPRILHE